MVRVPVLTYPDDLWQSLSLVQAGAGRWFCRRDGGGGADLSDVTGAIGRG